MARLMFCSARRRRGGDAGGWHILRPWRHAGEVGLDDGDGVRTLSRQCLRHRIVLGTFSVAAGGGFHGGRVEQEEQQQAKREQ